MNLTKRFILIPAIISCFLITAVSIQAAPSENPGNGTAGEQLVSIDFNNVDIVVFIKFISDLTKRNFIIDDKVKGKVTIISPGKITVSEAYKVFQSVLEVHGYATVASGQITKLSPPLTRAVKASSCASRKNPVLPATMSSPRSFPCDMPIPTRLKNCLRPW